MSETKQESSRALDTIKLGLALALLVGAIAAFYIMGDQAAYVRWPALLVGVIAALAVFGTTNNGSTIFGFIRGSRTEVRKMVWPTRKETLQTTLTIFIVVFLLGLFLWIVDLMLLNAVGFLTGRG